MTRVLFLSQRIGDPSLPSGGGAHLAATLAGLRTRFEVEAVLAEEDAHGVTGSARSLRRVVPARVRGLRRDLHFLADDRAFARRALLAARRFRPDVVYERSEYLAQAGAVVSRELGIPLVLEVNGLFVDDARTMYRSLAEPIGQLLERRKDRAAAALVTVSSGLARRLAERGADPSRIVVVPNTIDPGRAAAAPRAVDPSSNVVGFVGHLMPWWTEALETFIGDAPRLGDVVPDASFRIVGGGPGLARLRERVDRAGLSSRFVFTDVVPQERVPSEVARFDVGFVPPIFDYAFPVKLVELGAAGVPVVAPRSDDLDAMIAPGAEYEPFDPADTHGLVDALARVLAEPERRARLGAALHTAVRQRFTWDSSAVALAAVIERVLAER